MKTKIEDLEGQELDKAVADILGIKVDICLGGYLATEESIKYSPYSAKKYSPSTDWSQAGPIIEKYGICTRQGHSGWWSAYKLSINDDEEFMVVRRTLLDAAMSCFVKSQHSGYKGHENAFFPKEAAITAKVHWNNL